MTDTRVSPVTHARALAADYVWAVAVRRASIVGKAVPEEFARGDKPPVLLLPGVYETWHYLQFVGERLNAAGHPVHTVPALGYNARPIPESADLVAARLAELDLHDVVMVAHSKGGLIGKHAFLNPEVAGRVSRLVALATPFGGSSLAAWTIPRSLRAFRVSDPVIRALGLELALNSRITSIYPHFDPHIPESSRLEGARNVELPIVGHFRVLRDPVALDAMVEAVDAAA